METKLKISDLTLNYYNTVNVFTLKLFLKKVSIKLKFNFVFEITIKIIKLFPMRNTENLSFSNHLLNILVFKFHLNNSKRKSIDITSVRSE